MDQDGRESWTRNFWLHSSGAGGSQLRCRVHALVDVQDAAGGRLAEMRTAGVDLNTRQMRAGIGGLGNEVHTRRKHEVLTEVNAHGIPWPLAVADVP